MKTSLVPVLAVLLSAALVYAQGEGAPPAAPSSPGATAKVTLPQGNENPSASAQPPSVANVPGTPAGPAIEAPPDQKTPPEPPPRTTPVPSHAAESRPAAAPTGNKSAADAGHKAYILGPLDVVIVKIWNMDKLSGTYAVGGDGMLSMPLLNASGSIKADGLTTKQLADAITQRLKDCCLNNPEGEVDVQLGKNNSKFIYVYGAVGKPGEYPLDREDLSVMDALANVGGFRDFAKRKKIRIQRGSKIFLFNYNEVSKGKNLGQNIVLQNGDRIYVDE